MKSIDILLATFNGEEYLDSQMLSLFSQTYKHWRLLIHDDGSSDRTVELIKQYRKNDERIHLIEDGFKFGGAAGNFLHLLSFSDADLVIFCDQDDIWFENKLQLLVEEFSDESTPQAAFCNGFAYSAASGILADKITVVNPKTLNEQLFINAGIQGCSLMFNRHLREKARLIPDYVAMHDHFITLAMVCFAKISYVDKNLMLYRQFHSSKVTANIEFSLRNKIKSYFISNIPVVDIKHRDATLAFFEMYKTQLNQKQIQLFNAYFKYTTSNIFKRIGIVIRHKFTLYNSIFALIVKTVLRRPIN